MIFLETKIGKRDFAVLYRVENFSPLGDLGSLSETGKKILNKTELMLPPCYAVVTCCKTHIK